jgi:hypothetical protein
VSKTYTLEIRNTYEVNADTLEMAVEKLNLNLTNRKSHASSVNLLAQDTSVVHSMFGGLLRYTKDLETE